MPEEISEEDKNRIVALFSEQVRKQYSEEALRRILYWQVLGVVMAIVGCFSGIFAATRAVKIFALVGKEGIDSGMAVIFALGFAITSWLLLTSAWVGVLGVRRGEEIKKKIKGSYPF